jgi:hypothetical protein
LPATKGPPIYCGGVINAEYENTELQSKAKYSAVAIVSANLNKNPSSLLR